MHFAGFFSSRNRLNDDSRHPRSVGENGSGSGGGYDGYGGTR